MWILIGLLVNFLSNLSILGLGARARMSSTDWLTTIFIAGSVISRWRWFLQLTHNDWFDQLHTRLYSIRVLWELGTPGQWRPSCHVLSDYKKSGLRHTLFYSTRWLSQMTPRFMLPLTAVKTRTRILRCFFSILENVCKVFDLYLSVSSQNGYILRNSVPVGRELAYFM